MSGNNTQTAKATNLLTIICEFISLKVCKRVLAISCYVKLSNLEIIARHGWGSVLNIEESLIPNRNAWG